MTTASRDLALLGDQLVVLGVPSHLTATSDAAALISFAGVRYRTDIAREAALVR